MPYTPEQRRQLHTKQARLQVTSGVPSTSELKEGSGKLLQRKLERKSCSHHNNHH